MRKTFEFVKVGGVWFYWWPDFDGDPGELAMVGGADDLLDDRFVRLQMVDPSVAKIVLSKIEEDGNGATYLCKNYNDRVWICHYLRLLRKSMAGKILSETIVEARTIITKSMMKDCTAIKVIAEALEEYENNFNHKINILESKIILYEKERKAIIRHLKEGNIELLKSYFGIEK